MIEMRGSIVMSVLLYIFNAAMSISMFVITVIKEYIVGFKLLALHPLSFSSVE